MDAIRKAIEALEQARNSQHVLKAEGASPDATDRENCAIASPGGGPMGVGQAAAAAPAGATPCPVCSGGHPGLVDAGDGGFAVCDECGGAGTVDVQKGGDA